MNFENERPEKSKIVFLVEFVITTLIVFVVIYFSCMEVGATTVSDGDIGAVTVFEEKEGYFIYQISDTECVYVPEGYTYWIVFQRSSGYYSTVSNEPLYLHPGEDYIFSKMRNGNDWYAQDGSYYRSWTHDMTADDGHLYNKWSSGYTAFLGGNYITCTSGGTDATPSPDETPAPTLSPTPTVSSGDSSDAGDGYTLWSKPLGEYTVTEGLLLILVLCTVGLCVEKIIGGILNCRFLFKK